MKILHLLFISILLFATAIPAQASLVPVQKKTNIKAMQKSKNKRFKKRRKRRLKQQNDAGSTAIIAAAIAWYPISIILLIFALVFMINPLLVIAIILLCLPVLAFIILIIALLIDVSTNGFSLC